MTEFSNGLLEAARTNNVNLRGTRIEDIVTEKVNARRLDAIIFPLQPSGKLIVDIKTKFLDRASAPKAYNIDTMLRILSEPDVSFAFFFIGLDVARSLVRAHLISIFDPVIVEATRVQTHWAGRLSRGVTQFTGDISNVLLAEYRSSIDIPKAKLLLTKFIER